MIMDGLSSVISSIILYYSKSYLTHSLISAFGFISILLIIKYAIPETPYFLFSKRKLRELRSCLNEISKVNLGPDHKDETVDKIIEDLKYSLH